ncbi:MAG: NUDIX hydrolase [Candidatus Moranbacteria bacterium]|nr:NUDIX hydrolase [Candidatus Moranbacteria bacterium]
MNERGEFLTLQLPLNEEFTTEMWMLPGGRLEAEDEPEEGLRREVREETGLDIEIVMPIYTARWGIEDPPKYTVFYLCRAVGEGAIRMSDEHAQARWVRFDNLASIPWLNDNFRIAADKASRMIRLLTNE